MRMSKPTQTADPRTARRQQVLRLIEKHSIKSQAVLSEALEKAGIEVNQATLSRDLRDLGVVKGKDGYELPSGLQPTSHHHSLWHTVNQWLLSATPALNQLVLRTHKLVPLSTFGLTTIDGAEWYELFGSLSSQSLADVVVEEADVLASNALDAAEMISEWIANDGSTGEGDKS